MSNKIKNLSINKILEKSCLLTKNLLIAFLIAYYCSICIVELSLVTKKEELLKPSIYIFYSEKPLFFLLGLILKNIPSDIFILGISKYTIMYK